MANAFGVHCELIGPEHIHQHWPGIETRDVFEVLLPGTVKPTPWTLPLRWPRARVRRPNFEDTKVDRLAIKHNAVIGVYATMAPSSRVSRSFCCGYVVSSLAAQHNIHLPLHAAEHFYLVTEPLDTFTKMRPTLRVPDEQVYYK